MIDFEEYIKTLRESLERDLDTVKKIEAVTDHPSRRDLLTVLMEGYEMRLNQARVLFPWLKKE